MDIPTSPRSECVALYSDKRRVSGKGGWKAFLLDCRCFIGTIFSVAKGEGVVEGGTGELHRHSGPINPNDGKTVFPEDDFQVK